MDKRLLRLAFIFEFLLALIAFFTLWSQVGGQSHLDLMPWYLKLALGTGTAFAIVKATASAVERERAWNGATLKWFGVLIALLLGCGLLTWYEHIYEPQDEEGDEEPQPTLSLLHYQPPRAAVRRSASESALETPE